MKKQIVVIAGPTAVGKTKFALRAAKALDGEIVSCDSMQIYKYMNIGSAKPSAAELRKVRHHLVDFVDPSEDFSVARYQKLAKEAIAYIFSRGKIPVVAGGTGLYLNSLLYEMDFSQAQRDEQLRRTLSDEAELLGADYLYEKLRAKDPEAASRIHPHNVTESDPRAGSSRAGQGRARFQRLQRKM